jgi:hypothetical protein
MCLTNNDKNCKKEEMWGFKVLIDVQAGKRIKQ